VTSTLHLELPRAFVHQAAELARECSSATVRERVLVSRAVGLLVRDYLRRSSSLVVEDGRSGSARYLDLLDVCDFKAGDWSVEVRAVANVSKGALYVPTMPLMVGILSDFYISAQVNADLSGVDLHGFATRNDIASAELTSNGLFAVLPYEDLRPFAELPNELIKPAGSHAEDLRTFEEWQAVADRIIRAVGELVAAESVFDAEHVERLATGIRDLVIRMYGERLPATGLEPLFEQLFRRFGIRKPLRSKPGSPVVFKNQSEDDREAASAKVQEEFFQDKLSVVERVSLYRHLLEDGEALAKHRRVRRTLDRVTKGKHQATTQRRERIRTARREKLAEGIDLPPVPPPGSGTSLKGPSGSVDTLKVRQDSLRLEDIKKDASIAGIEPGQVVRVVTTEPVGENALTVYYKTPDGRLLERMIFRTDEASLSLADVGRPWAFDAPGDDFKIAAEAYRINLAYLFDPMMAVHTSNVVPLPHQITAVYESMLPRQPLRYMLADDPGAGKTIMAGLYIREMLMRADARRVLIVAPGSLVEQWQDEMYEKFGLDFTIFSREQIEQSRSGNPFDDVELLIARLDQLSRSEELQEKLRLTQWDMVIVDEAHKLSASYYGNKVEKTKRFKLGELLGSIARHFLLMTATPHNGKEEDFQLFLSLLDSDRFYGKPRDGAHKVDVTDMMRRMVKEEMLRFDGTPLFPERRAYTTNYKLSDLEAALYEAVTHYVKEEWKKVDDLGDAKRKGSVGFALTALQRRLASSPEAIYQSLKRRRSRLKRRVEEEKLRQRGGAALAETMEWSIPEDADDLNAEEQERLEEEVVDQATAAQTIQELEAEIHILWHLEEQARKVVLSEQDRKWDELSKLLQNTPEMRDSSGLQRKLIIFSEHRDTLNYLVDRIGGLLGTPGAIVTIHGGVKREDRRKVQERFRNDPTVRVLIATDAAGEGVNLQNANLMVNYDLPWNPNRLEQRFGRIHRIGQTEVCHLWNMVANETREGDVFQRLFDKLEVERKALGGRVFDILGEVFEEESLRDLLIRAIRYGEDPEVRDRLLKKVEGVLDTDHLKSIIHRNALCDEVMDENRLFAVREEMEKAEARKLQPYFIRSFFTQVFESLGGEMRPRETGRWEITHVPPIIRERDRQITGRDRRNLNSVMRKYERVCFEKDYVRLLDRAGAPMATLIHPGHPLMQAVTDVAIEQHRNKLKQGAVLVDPNDAGVTPRVTFIVDHSVKEGRDQERVVSRRMQFVSIDSQGDTTNAGWAPHLDLEPISEADMKLVADLLSAPWITQNLEQVALGYASTELVPAHFTEVRERRERQVDKTLAAVHERLVKEINFWSDRYIKLKEDLAAGKDVRLPLDNVRRTIEDLTARRQSREKELLAMRHVISATPVIIGGALVIPGGLLAQRKGETGWSADTEARARVERVALDAVMSTERDRGHEVFDVSAEKCGWDVTSIPRAPDGRLAQSRHIEVKGRAKGQSTITVTKNEVLYALNQTDKFILAIVLVDGDQYEGPFYIRRPFTQEPDWAVTSINLDLAQLLARAELPL
jgi:superfamily II DNA or RNA helicase